MAGRSAVGARLDPTAGLRSAARRHGCAFSRPMAPSSASRGFARSSALGQAHLVSNAQLDHDDFGAAPFTIINVIDSRQSGPRGAVRDQRYTIASFMLKAILAGARLRKVG